MCNTLVAKGGVMSKTNLCVFGLIKEFADDIAKDLAIRLDMYYANVEEIIEFELIDLKFMEEVCGLDYLNKKELSIVRRLCTYDNTLMNINFNKLNSNKFLESVKKNCLIIYLEQSKKEYKRMLDSNGTTDNEKKICMQIFDDRHRISKNIADITIDCSDIGKQEILDKIITEILKIYVK